MYARVIRVEAKSKNAEDVRKLAKQVIPGEPDKVEGVGEFLSLVRNDGKIMNVGPFDSRHDALAATARIVAARQQVTEMLASRPTPEDYQVLIHERPD